MCKIWFHESYWRVKRVVQVLTHTVRATLTAAGLCGSQGCSIGATEVLCSSVESKAKLTKAPLVVTKVLCRKSMSKLVIPVNRGGPKRIIGDFLRLRRMMIFDFPYSHALYIVL